MTAPNTRLTAAGYRVLDPTPAPEDVAAFFATRYFALVDADARAPDLARDRRGGEEAEEQARWLAHTLHRDVADAFAPGVRTLDVGCGSGALAAFLAARGFRAEGCDLAPEAVASARARGVTAHAGALPDLLAAGVLPRGGFGGVSMVGVLEHASDPEGLVAAAFEALAPKGVFALCAGNQFNPLQEAAVAALDLPRWWISAPDHLNYFDHASLARLLRDAGFDVIDQRADFPMEMFLLMGEDYIRDPAVGRACHARRVRFEMAAPTPTRRAFGRALAAAGMGRRAFLVATRP